MQRLFRSLFFFVFWAGLRVWGQGSLPDHFAAANLVTQEEFGITTIISTNLASAEPGEPDHAGQPASHSQWFRVQYANSGYLTLFVNTLPGFRMAVYTGSSLETLQEVTSRAIRLGDQVLGFRVDAGVEYSVAIELSDPPPRGTIQSFRGSFGRLYIAPESSVLPARSPATAAFSLESGDPSEYPLDVTFLVNGQARTNLTAPPWRFELTADRGGPTMISARVRTNLRSSVNVRNIQWTLVAGNDSWSEAAVIPGSASDWSTVENLVFSSVDSGEPPIDPAQAVVRSVWWKWVPQFSGEAQFTASGAIFQIFTGETLAGLTLLPIGGNQPFAVLAGTTYYIRLAQSFESPSGGLTLALQRPVLRLEPPPGFLVEQPGNQHPTVHLTAGVDHRLRVTEFNPEDDYPAIYLRDVGASDATMASVVESPREFSLTPVLGQMTTWRVVGTNQHGEERISAPLTVVGAVPQDQFAQAVTLPSNGLSDWDWSGLFWTSREQDEPDPGFPGGSLWYRWTAPVSGTARVKVSLIPRSMMVSAYTGSTLTNLTRVAWWLGMGSNPFEMAVPVEAGKTYFWQVVGEPPEVPAQLTVETTGVFGVSPELKQGVPVELRSFRAVDGENETITWWLGSNVLTNQSPNPQAVSTWIPSESGVFNLRAIAKGTAGERVLFDVTGWIRPTNDRADDSQPVVPVPGVPSQTAAIGSLAGATLEAGEIPGFELGQGTVWFDWTVPTGGPARIRQIRGADPVQVELWERGPNGALTPRGKWAQLHQPVPVDLPPGTTCRFAVSSPDPDAGEFELRLGVAPPNDLRQEALELAVPPAGGSVPLFTSTVFASSEPGETNLPTLGEFQRYGTLWWKFTAPEHGGALFHWLESEHPNQAAVFTGTTWSDLKLLVGQEVTSGNPVAWLPFRTRPGVTYWIAAGANENFDSALGTVAGSFDYLAVPELVNDDFADRLQLDGPAHTIRSSNQHASRESGEPAGLNQTLWWDWTAPLDGAVRIAVAPVDGGGSGVRVFTGDMLSTLQLATETGEVFVTAGERLKIAVGLDSMNAGPFELTIRWRQVLPPSTNDSFAGRPSLPLGDSIVVGSLQGATLEPGEPSASPGGSLWWSFTAPVTGVLEVLSVSSDSFSPMVELFTGETLETLRPSDWILGPRLAWPVSAGGQYALRLSSGSAAQGEFELHTRFWAPTNDLFEEAIDVSGVQPEINTWLVGATVELGEPLPAPTLGQSLWWRWTAPADGRLEQKWLGESVLPASVYRGNVLTGLSPVPTVVPSPHLGTSSAVRVNAGESYYVQFTAEPGIAFPLVNPLVFAAFGTSDNDAFAQARPIEGPAVATMAAASPASREPGEPVHGVGADHGSLWWRYTPPNDGTVTVKSLFGTVQDVVLAVYRGSRRETLQRVGAGTKELSFAGLRGEAYFIAAEVPPGITGDVGLQIVITRGGNGPQTIPGNLVKNYSFEQTVEDVPTVEWQVVVGADWVLRAPGSLPAADGANYVLLGGNFLRQTLPTIPGRSYRIRLATRSSLEEGQADLAVRFGGVEVGRIQFPSTLEERFWHWRDYEVIALTNLTELELWSGGASVALDAISVVPLQEPPQVIQEPQDVLVVVGGSVTLSAGISGSEPLVFQWFHQGQALAGETGRQLTLRSITLEAAGTYQVQATNPWGSATNRPLTLTVESGQALRLLRQPVGASVALGQYLVLDVLAAGATQLEYQWFRDGVTLENGTNRHWILESVSLTDLGKYHVRVRSSTESVVSLPAPVVAAANRPGGGWTDFAAWKNSPVPFVVQVTDVDGVSPLLGNAFVAQLYAGPTAQTLRPVGRPSSFLTGALAGRWAPQTIQLPQTAGGESFVAQVRVWESSFGASYEEARALGGRFGRSDLATGVAASALEPPTAISTFSSFALQAGQPGFTVGRIDPVSVQADGSVSWRLTGAVGYRYLLERLTDGTTWEPVQVWENFSGNELFTSPATSGTTVFLRARLLD